MPARDAGHHAPTDRCSTTGDGPTAQLGAARRRPRPFRRDTTMRITSQYTASLLRRVHEFLTRQPVSVVMGDLALPMAQLEATIKELESHGADSESRRRSSMAGTGRINALTRQARLEYMRPLARAARLLFRHDPALRASLQVRLGLRRPSAVIEALRGMADVAAPYKDALLKAGFAEDFSQRMHAFADLLKGAIDARAQELGKRAGASVGLVHEAERGRQLVRLIDAMVSPRLEATPIMLGEWKSLLKQGRVRPPVDVVQPVAPSAPATPSTPAPASHSLPAAA